MKILAVIPARYASTRFPGKVLADIEGKPMIERVFRQVQQAKLPDSIVVATDHPKVAEVVRSFGAPVVMTKAEHPSGTDRCMEALEKQSDSFDFVINVQGDEPFIHPEQIDLLARQLNSPEIEIATLVHRIGVGEELQNPNVVKVTISKGGEALYFSRSPIPFVRNKGQKTTFYRHIGLYGYRTDVLRKLTKLPPSMLEETEGLEQLRWLENGFRIRVAETPFASQGIDTPEDLERLLKQR